MVELRWTKQDIYNLLRNKGLTALLKTFHAIKEELEESILSSESARAGKESLKLIENEILNKIRSSGVLFMLYSKATNLPFVDCYDTEMDFRAYMFSDMKEADLYKEKKLKDGYETGIEEIVTGKKRSDFYTNLMLRGVNFIVLDPDTEHTFALSINMVTELPRYDGFGGMNTPLINCTFNAILNDYSQRVAAGKMTEEFEKKLFELMKGTYFVTPVNETGDIDKIDHKEISFHYYMFQEENDEGIWENFIPIFTDSFSMMEQQASGELGNKGAILPFMTLFDLLNEYNVKYFIINWGTSSLILNGETLVKIRNIQ